jgi:hypothetical protein
MSCFFLCLRFLSILGSILDSIPDSKAAKIHASHVFSADISA